MKLLAILAFASLTSSAFADLSLSNNGKIVTCVDGDELALKISADRKSMTLRIRDNNYGKLPVIKVLTDNSSYLSFQTKVGTLNFMDTHIFFEDKWQAYFPDCQ